MQAHLGTMTFELFLVFCEVFSNHQLKFALFFATILFYAVFYLSKIGSALHF